MKFSNLLKESRVSGDYSTILNKLKDDASNVEKYLEYSEDDLYKNPGQAKKFWVEFYEDMDMLEKVVSAYSQILDKIDSGDSIVHEFDLGSLKTDLKKFAKRLRKEANEIDYIKKMEF